MDTIRVPSGTVEEQADFIRGALIDRGIDPDSIYPVDVPGFAGTDSDQPLVVEMTVSYEPFDPSHPPERRVAEVPPAVPRVDFRDLERTSYGDTAVGIAGPGEGGAPLSVEVVESTNRPIRETLEQWARFVRDE